MEIPADRLVDLHVEELVASAQPKRCAYWRTSGSVVVCTLTGAHRAVFPLEGLSEYEMRLALAPVLAAVQARGGSHLLHDEPMDREDAPTLYA